MSITCKESNNITEESTTDTAKIFMDLKFSGNTADMIVKNCIKKLYKCFKEEATVKFFLHYQTIKLQAPFVSQSSVV